MKQKIFTIALLVWSLIWVWFIMRDLVIKKGMKDYSVLISRTLDGKRSYVTGDRLYEFIKFSINQIPAHDTFRVEGFDDGSIEHRRIVYYMYPRMESLENPGYILVYDKPGYDNAAYEIAAKMDDSMYLLKKKKGS